MESSGLIRSIKDGHGPSAEMPPKQHEQRGLLRCGFTIAAAAAAAAAGDTEPPAGDNAAEQ